MTKQKMILEDLALKIQKGEDHWDRLFKVVNPKVINWCKGNEDLAQLVWIKIFTKIKTFDTKRHFLSWAKIITKNTVTDYMRQNKLETMEAFNVMFAPSSEEFPDLNAEISETKMIVKSAMLELEKTNPESYATLVEYSEGNSYAEISENLDIPLGTVKSRLGFGKTLLKKTLHGKGITGNIERTFGVG